MVGDVMGLLPALTPPMDIPHSTEMPFTSSPDWGTQWARLPMIEATVVNMGK